MCLFEKNDNFSQSFYRTRYKAKVNYPYVTCKTLSSSYLSLYSFLVTRCFIMLSSLFFAGIFLDAYICLKAF